MYFSEYPKIRKPNARTLITLYILKYSILETGKVKYTRTCQKLIKNSSDLTNVSANWQINGSKLISCILQWNVPLILFAMKVAPCVALGNVTVIKPAEQTPLTTLYAASLVKEVSTIIK